MSIKANYTQKGQYQKAVFTSDDGTTGITFEAGNKICFYVVKWGVPKVVKLMTDNNFPFELSFKKEGNFALGHGKPYYAITIDTFDTRGEHIEISGLETDDKTFAYATIDGKKVRLNNGYRNGTDEEPKKIYFMEELGFIGSNALKVLTLIVGNHIASSK